MHLWLAKDLYSFNRFKTITQAYLNKTSIRAIIIVCDLTEVNKTNFFKGTVAAHCNEKFSQHIKIVVGSKLDAITTKEPEVLLMQIAKEHGCFYQSVSAKTGEGITELFDMLANALFFDAIDDNAIPPFNSQKRELLLDALNRIEDKWERNFFFLIQGSGFYKRSEIIIRRYCWCL